jgi:hypothetical protein
MQHKIRAVTRMMRPRTPPTIPPMRAAWLDEVCEDGVADGEALVEEDEAVDDNDDGVDDKEEGAVEEGRAEAEEARELEARELVADVREEVGVGVGVAEVIDVDDVVVGVAAGEVRPP